MEDPAADAVGELVLRALRREGRRAAVIARPDREDRVHKGADFLLAVDDMTVALEVTTTAMEQERRLDALGDRLADGIRLRLRDEVTEAAIGRVVVYAAPTLRDGEPPRRRDVDTSVGPIVERLRATMASAIQTRERLELGQVGVVERLTIHVYPNSSAGISVISQSPRGGFVGPVADLLVRHTLASKAEQLAQYAIAHLALVQNVMLLDPEDVREAFARLSDEVPANWHRVWVVAHEHGDWSALPVWTR